MIRTIFVSPALEALKHHVNTRIFQNTTVPEILKIVLSQRLSAYNRRVEFKLNRMYPIHEYRTQYNESDYNFCKRLMEEEGIAYWFEFDDNTKTLILADEFNHYGKVESIAGPQIKCKKHQGFTDDHWMSGIQ